MDKISKINNKNIVDTALNSSVVSENIDEMSSIIIYNNKYLKSPISSLFNYVKDKIISSINTTNDSLRNALVSWLNGQTLSVIDTSKQNPINSMGLNNALTNYNGIKGNPGSCKFSNGLFLQ